MYKPVSLAKGCMGCGSSAIECYDPRTIVVFGATGLLGGAVCRALLADHHHHYVVRAITRRPSKGRAMKLAEEGAVIMRANMSDTQSLEEALDGADAIFLTTHYWEDKNKDKEIFRGFNVIDIAVQKGIDHIVFNGSENVKKRIGKDCGHLDSKAAIEDYLKEVCTYTGMTYTVLRLPFWYEDFYSLFKPHEVNDNVYAVAIPLEHGTMDAISIVDVGICVRTIFNKQYKYTNRVLGLTGDHLTTQKIAHLFQKHFGNRKFCNPMVRVKDYEKFDFPGAKDLAAMFELYQQGGLNRNHKLTRKLNPRVRSLDKWLDHEHAAIEDSLD